MELKRFKEKNRKKESMILFTILCILLIGGVFFYSSFALFEVKEEFNVIKGNVENPGDLYFAYYVDDVVTLDMPNKDSGYTLSSKSSCTNGVTLSFDDENWTLLVNYSNYKQETSSRTKCTLYFEEVLLASGTLRTIGFTDSKGMWQYKGQITKLIIEDKINVKKGAIASFDESVDQNGSVMSYIIENKKENETEETTYTAYLQSNKKLYLSRGENLFKNFQKLETIEGMRYMDTSNVTDMSLMFLNCTNLREIDVSNFNTINVTYMANMFTGCSSLVTLDLSNFNTEKVIYMISMFSSCSSLVTLDLSNFNTKNVTHMNNMFYGCSSLTSLDLNDFNTLNVTRTDSMFQDCSSLKNINYGENFVNLNNIYIEDMFLNCPANKPEHESWNGVL